MLAVGGVADSAIGRVADRAGHGRRGRHVDPQVHPVLPEVLLQVVVGHPGLHQAVPELFIHMKDLLHGLQVEHYLSRVAGAAEPYPMFFPVLTVQRGRLVLVGDGDDGLDLRHSVRIHGRRRRMQLLAVGNHDLRVRLEGSRIGPNPVLAQQRAILLNGPCERLFRQSLGKRNETAHRPASSISSSNLRGKNYPAPLFVGDVVEAAAAIDYRLVDNGEGRGVDDADKRICLASGPFIRDRASK